MGAILGRGVRYAIRDALRAGWLAAALLACACSPTAPTPVQGDGEWREFQGVWTATGTRQSISLGDDRRASIASFNGTLMLSGAGRPNVGFHANAIVLNDTATGAVGRAVWTDERGDKAYSELRGGVTSSGNRLFGTLIGGTGRYAGATGTYEFAWRFVLEDEDGSVQGQSEGLKGRVRFGREAGKP
jgi:hypothetical protein